MSGLDLPVWIAHGEGQISVSDTTSVAMTYNGFPFNGSSIAAITSDDGKVLGMFPHPERSFIPWQLPIRLPSSWEGRSAWSKLFINAYRFSIMK
jgi:phosphoribosylformylglycinamidine synthase